MFSLIGHLVYGGEKRKGLKEGTESVVLCSEHMLLACFKTWVRPLALTIPSIPRPKESEKKIAKIKLRKSSVHWFQMHLQATRNIIGT